MKNWRTELLTFTEEQERGFAKLLEHLDTFDLAWSIKEGFAETRNTIMQYAVGWLRSMDLPFSATFDRLEDYARKRFAAA